MIPIGAIISLAGQAAAGVMSAVNNRRSKAETAAEYARRLAHYEAEAAENPASRSEAQAVINQYDRKANKQSEKARNVAAITGATPEYTLGVEKAEQEGRADLLSNISYNASRRADVMEEKAEKAREEEYAAEMARREARNDSYKNVATNAANSFGAIVDSYQTPSDNVAVAKVPSSNGTVADTAAMHGGNQAAALTAAANTRADGTPEKQVLTDMALAKAKMATNAAIDKTPTTAEEPTIPEEWYGRQKMPWEN